MIKHFVTFYSPGTFVAESTTKPIIAWNINKAIKMSKGIQERYGALPYGFQFITKQRREDELDSRIVDRSGIYYLGGEVLTLEQVKEKNDPNNETLIRNMECNGWDKIVINTNSWTWIQPLTLNDKVLDIN